MSTPIIAPPTAPGTGSVYLPSKEIPIPTDKQNTQKPQEPEVSDEQKKEARESMKADTQKQLDVELALQESYDEQMNAIMSQPMTMESTQILQMLQQNRQMSVANTRNLEALLDAVDDEDKFDLQDLAVLTLTAGAGLSIFESVDRMINGDDNEGKSFTEQFLERTDITTDPAVRQKIIDASYGDARALTDLENLTSYGNQFGSLSNDMFNGQYGQALEQAYQKFINTEGNPQIGRDQFLVEYAQQNPTDPISQDIQKRLSRIGQVERSSRELGQIDRNLIKEGFADAGKFYQSADQGGYGFTPDMFRSGEQNQVVENALGLINSPSQDLLEQRLTERVKSNGKLDQGTLREITDDALGSTGYFADQPYLKSGGAGQAILNTGREMRARMLQDEQSLFSLLQGQRAYATPASNVVNANTVDPIKAMGLGTTTTGQADKLYQSNPTTGLSLTGNNIPYDNNTGGLKTSNSQEVNNIGMNLLTIDQLN